MKNFTSKFLCLPLFFLCFSLYSQIKAPQEQSDICATDEYNARLLQDYPRMMGSQAYEEEAAPRIAAIRAQMNENEQRALQFTIPVVVHVIHNGEPIGTGANISDANVLSGIRVLNEDFRRMVGTRGFNSHPDGADVEVEFCLAKQTPDGCPTTGIDRIDMSSVSTSWSGPGPGNTNDILKPTTIWDPSKYLNIWSVNFSAGGLLGFAQFPGGPANTDGVVTNYLSFGSNDDPNVTIGGAYNLGRTNTHEIGHYLALFHTFQGGCDGFGDYCDDTPPIAAPSGGCPTGADTCPSAGVDMVENYMDYSVHACMNIFTNDQKARVIDALTNAPNRPNTFTSDVCTELASVNDDGSIEINGLTPGFACSGEFTPSIKVTNYGTVALTSATITYDIDGGTSTNIPWSGGPLAYGESVDIDLPVISASGGIHALNVAITAPNGNTDQRDCNDTATVDFIGIDSFASTTQVNLTIVTDDYGEETSWEFRDGSDTVLYSSPANTYDDNTTYNETFDVNPDECYRFIIYDDYGDGVCCAYGIGSYELRTDDNTLIFAGGEFSASETTEVSTTALSVSDYFTETGISIFPNPTSSTLNIKLGNANNLPDSYEIFNILGQSITHKTINSNVDLTFDSSTLSNGMYFIKISKENASITLPFIKK